MSSKGFKRILDKAAHGERLGRAMARDAMDCMISGKLHAGDIASFLTAVKPRHLGAQELAGFAEAMRAKAVTVKIDRKPVIDTCGTGGDGLSTFNFSTAAAFVVAGAGVAVAKHGNRAVSSRSGSADVLEAMGVPIELEPDSVQESIEDHGFGFFFAPRFHPAMRHVAPVRKALGVRTVFNLLGPLANPALVRRQVVGLYEESLMKEYAETLMLLGSERVILVRGEDGMDEISLAGPTIVCHGDAKKGIRMERVTPESFGFARVDPGSLRGGDAMQNARLMEELLTGADGPLLNGTLINAAAALLAAGVATHLREGVSIARESITSGRARGVLEKVRKR